MNGSMINQTFCSYADLAPLGATGGSSETGQSLTETDSLSTPMKTPGISRSYSTEGIPSDAIRNTTEFIWLRDPKTGNVWKRSHGKKATYNAGCHCDRCKEGRRKTTNAQKLKALQQGGTHRYDTDVIRRHCLKLMEDHDMSVQEISRQCGMSRTNLARILFGVWNAAPPKTTGKEVGDRILAVTGREEDIRLPKGSISSDLSSKRLRSLAALGWTPVEVWRVVHPDRPKGRNPGSTYRDLVYRPESKPTIWKATAEEIRTAYQTIGDEWAPVPERFGPDGRVNNLRSQRTRMIEHAKRNGWGSPASWEDPGTLTWPSEASDYEEPEPVSDSSHDWVVSERLAVGIRTKGTFDDRVEGVRLMLQRGVGRNDIRRQLGISTQTWRKIERCL